ncbi:MAG TPA: DUF1684 domain-containing protein [Candidatus Limnocylindrales bacterium]|jgi:hypothetical protein
MTDDEPPAAGDRAWLADWRRRVAELYAEVRAIAADDPAGAWDTWRRDREALYRTHPQSPVPLVERDSFRARHWPYDDRLRWSIPIEPASANDPASRATARTPPTAAFGGLAISPVELPNSGTESPAFDRLGVVRLALPAGEATLPLFWMRGYAGGLFLPFQDATNGAETYGAGRYLLDTAKGADLGGDPAAGTLIVDANFAFQPSCAFDPRWACPLAGPGSRLRSRVEAGERLR